MYPLLANRVLKKLVTQARKFQRSKAWNETALPSLIGFIEPKSNIKYFCNVIGSDQGMQALNIYPKEAGLLKCLDARNPYCIDASFQQDIISFSIDTWDELQDEEYDQYKELNFKFPQNKCFIFHRYHTGYYPITMNKEDSDILMIGFEVIQHALSLIKDEATKNCFSRKNNSLIAMFTMVENEWVLGFEDIQDYRMTLEITPIDSYVNDTIRNFKNEDTWELGIYYLPTPLPSIKPYHFYFPQTLFVFDKEKTEIVGLIIKEEMKPIYSLSEKFFEVIKEQRCKPEKIIFRNPQTAALFTGVEEALDCKCFFNFSKESVLDDIWKGYSNLTQTKPKLKN
ncbi:MAG: hypothetical protein RR959_06280 [Erysipelotrichaceae bacterium]